MRWRWFVVFCCACDSGAAIGASEQPIIDGRPATASEIGATVALVGRDGYNFCSGTLVAPDVVVTAAHCLYTPGRYEEFGPLETADNVFVAAGVMDALDASGGDVYSVRLLAAHSAFPAGDPESPDPLIDEMDIGVLVLSEPVRDVTPVPVLHPSELDAVLVPGRMMGAAGFGTTDPRGERENSRLHVASLPYVRRSAYELIAGEGGGPDTCYGDSGGPLYGNTPDGLRLVGVTSRGVDPNVVECVTGTIFTLAPAFLGYLEGESGRTLTSGDPGMPDPDPTPDAGPGPEIPWGGSDAGVPRDPSEDPMERRPSADLSGGCSAGGEPPLLALWPFAIAWLVRRWSSRRR
jgi:hypothetical protein